MFFENRNTVAIAATLPKLSTGSALFQLFFANACIGNSYHLKCRKLTSFDIVIRNSSKITHILDC